MSNYDESHAPYNINDTSFKFDVELDGRFYFSYYDNLNQEEARKALIDKIREVVRTCPDIDIDSIKATFK